MRIDGKLNSIKILDFLSVVGVVRGWVGGFNDQVFGWHFLSVGWVHVSVCMYTCCGWIGVDFTRMRHPPR